MRQVHFSPQARSDLDEIWEYTAARWGVDQARAYTEAISRRCQLAAEGSFAMQDVSHIRARYHRFRSGSHFAFVIPRSDGLAVMRILHERMNFAAHLP